MKNSVVQKEENWIWPIADENSWKYQNEYKDLVSYILPHVKDHSVMIQAGGNCGFILNTFVDHFDSIYTFEPDSINFYCLNRNVTSNKVIKFQACLGNTHQLVAIQQLIRLDRPNDTGGVHVSGIGNVPTLRIDDLNLNSCGLIQLDIEGYELEALVGGIMTIRKYKPILCIEFCEKWLNRYNATEDTILNLLESLGYIQVLEYGSDKVFKHRDNQ